MHMQRTTPQKRKWSGLRPDSWEIYYDLYYFSREKDVVKSDET